jgi:hypothetical protein
MNMAGGDNDGDDQSAAPLWDGADSTSWRPPCWSKSPDALAAEAKAMNHAGYASAAANAGKHSNPPNDPWARPF